MDPERWRRIEEVFDAARACRPAQRAAFLDRVCGEDEDLKQQVRSLLSASERMGEFLASPAFEDTVDLAGAASGIERAGDSALGKYAGPYRLEAVIASGGMGTVYRASRDDREYGKTVAVKLIRHGMGSAEIVQRFLRERQALASLDHHNIARLLDGGTTDDGLPYLVMEHIQGSPIDRYCDAHRLSTPDRLDLFLQVCGAVQYAHQKLIVHRDLKPSNILVTEEGVPKLLDFGIAKILDPEVLEADGRTLTARRILTPEFASPEQIRGDPVSAASDVYSLGVVLYELLTGHFPYHVRGRSPREIERAVCEQEPIKPSSVIFRTDRIRPRADADAKLTPEAVSRTRDGRPEKLRRRLRGDLDHIVLAALRKEPDRRYVSVEQFAEDLRRHQGGRPVIARKGTLRYRAGKFASRHRAGLAATGLVLITVVAAIVVALEQRSRSIQDRERREALQRVVRFVAEFLTLPNTRDEARRMLLTQGAERLLEELRRQPEQAVDHAEAVARKCEEMHLLDLAIQWQRMALEIRRQAGSRDPKRIEAHFRLARLLHRIRDLSGAMAQLVQAQELLGESPAGAGVSALDVWRERAAVLWSQGRCGQAEALYRACLRRVGSSGAPVRARAATMMELAALLDERGEVGEAGRLFRQALDLARRASPEDPILEAEVRHRLGAFLWFTPSFRNAEVHLRSALGTYLSLVRQHRILGEDPRVSACMNDLSLVMGCFGAARKEAEPSVADRIWRMGRERIARVFGDSSLEVMDSLLTMARMKRKDFLVRQILEVYRRTYPEGHLRIAEVMSLLGACLTDVGARKRKPDQLAQGEPLLREALRIRRARLGAGHWKTALVDGWLGWNLTAQGKLAQAGDKVWRGYRSILDRLGPRHPVTGIALEHLVVWCRARGATEEANVLGRRYAAGRWAWPFTEFLGDGDLDAEGHANIDFEDDHIEKVIVIPGDPRRATSARLWIYGRPCNWPWRDFVDQDDYCINVNDVHEIRFSVGQAFLFLDCYQWIPFDIPAAWLVEGPNRIMLYERHDPNYRRSMPWQYNNLRIGVDTEHDADHSWWFGSGGSCCAWIKVQAERAHKPLLRTSPLIADHRRIGHEGCRGFNRCRGELMIFLDLSTPAER